MIAFEKIRGVAVSHEEPRQFFVRHPAQDGGICDFVAIQMQNWKDGSVANRIQKLVGVPARCQGTRFGLPIADHAANEETRIIKSGAVGVGERVTEFATFMYRSRRFGCDVAGDASRKRELFEKSLQALLIT